MTPSEMKAANLLGNYVVKVRPLRLKKSPNRINSYLTPRKECMFNGEGSKQSEMFEEKEIMLIQNMDVLKQLYFSLVQKYRDVRE
jgi:hypothetical protein